MTNEKQKWTVLNILNTTTEFFTNRNFENPRLNAEQLLAHVLKSDRVHLYLQFEKTLTANEVDLYRQYVKRRSEFEPLQYIIGETEFMGLTFKVTPDVLIPRPETEILVENVLNLKDDFREKQVNIWDIGTGSGCIAASIAKHWANSCVFASDVSREALSMARHNAQINQVENIHFFQHDILNSGFPLKKSADIIVSNPPYISESEFTNLAEEISKFEPQIALTDQSDGLKFYRSILRLIAETNACKLVFLELSGTQTDKIIELAHSYNFSEIHVIPDLNQISRILKIQVV